MTTDNTSPSEATSEDLRKVAARIRRGLPINDFAGDALACRLEESARRLESPAETPRECIVAGCGEAPTRCESCVRLEVEIDRRSRTAPSSPPSEQPTDGQLTRLLLDFHQRVADRYRVRNSDYALSDADERKLDKQIGETVDAILALFSQRGAQRTGVTRADPKRLRHLTDVLAKLNIEAGSPEAVRLSGAEDFLLDLASRLSESLEKEGK